MFAKTLIAAAALAVTVVGASAGGNDAEARELNQRQTIDAGHNAQIQRTIARMRRQGAVIEDNVSGGCGGQSVGTVTVEGRAPREVNTVVLGNVINYVGAGGC